MRYRDEVASKLFHSVVVVGAALAGGATVGAIGALTGCSSSSTPDAHIPDANFISIFDGPRAIDATVVTPDARPIDANATH